MKKTSGVWKNWRFFRTLKEVRWISESELDGTSVSRSDEEMEEIVGEDGGGTNSVAGSSIAVLWVVVSEGSEKISEVLWRFCVNYEYVEVEICWFICSIKNWWKSMLGSKE